MNRILLENRGDGQSMSRLLHCIKYTPSQTMRGFCRNSCQYA